MAGLTLSMTGLIVSRTFKVFREFKACTAEDQILGVTLQRVIFILIESGMTLFLIQLSRLVATNMGPTGSDGAYAVHPLLTGIYEMLNVIIRSVITTLYY